MKILRVICLAALLAALLVLAPSGVNIAQGEILEIPMDAVHGSEPLKSGYLSDTVYEDPSISVTIERGRIYDTGYLVAHIKLANATQLRTAFAEGKYSKYEERRQNPLTMAKKAMPVFAINGDFYGDARRRNKGIVIRQGTVYRDFKDNIETDSKRAYDLLLIDFNGDFHILKQATLEDYKAWEGKIMHGFTFGPGLIIDGERQTDFVNMNNAVNKEAQRMVIAQVGELEYLCVCTEGGPDDPQSVGLTMDQLADLLSTFDGVQSPYKVQNAYNLDGGSSSWMIFQQKGKYDKINCLSNPKRSSLCDIIYFASAYQPD